MKLSIYQENIIDWVKNGEGNACCDAVAGSSKSTTLRLAALALTEKGIHPSQIKICVFGKANAQDLLTKFGRGWENSISTLHSAGWSLLKQHLSFSYAQIDTRKYSKIAKKFNFTKKKSYLIKNKIIGNDKSFTKLLDLIRLTNSSYSVESIEEICEHFELSDIFDYEQVLNPIIQCLDEGERLANRSKNPQFDFTDQIWLPVKWELTKKDWFTEYNFVLVDECLVGESLITLEDGTQKTIKEIVENKLKLSVLSYNEQRQTIESKKIVGWKKVPRRERKILSLGNLKGTFDHPIYTLENKYVSMEEVVKNKYSVLVLDSEKIRSQCQVNRQREIDSDRVTTWRCFDQSREMERSRWECESKVCSRNCSTSLFGMETRGDETLDWNSNEYNSYTYSVRRSNTQSNYFDSSCIYRNMAFNKTREQQEEENYFRTSTLFERFSDSSLVHGRREYETDRLWGYDSNLCFSPRRFRFSLPVSNRRKENNLQSYRYLQGKRHLYKLSGNFSFERTISPLYSPSSSLQRESYTERNDLYSLWRNIHECNPPENLQPDMSKKLRYKDSIFEENEWVYCLDVEDNHNFFANNILVHNCQDLNTSQLELAISLVSDKGRLLFVGDKNQSIMGFSGADCNSYENILIRTNATELPLSVCYRCPESHLKLVRNIFPSIPIEAKPDAVEGTISTLSESDLWGNSDSKLITGDMVLSRKTAPLVTLCIKLISQGIAATVKGKAIGELLKEDLKEISEIYGFNYSDFHKYLEIYRSNKQSKFYGKDNSEQLIETLKDKLKALSAIYVAQSSSTSIKDLEDYIDKLFSDGTSPITLSTCHRAKGLEAERVFIIEPESLPLFWKNQNEWQLKQEYNLLYVALTRSKSDLFIVGQPRWMKKKESGREIL